MISNVTWQYIILDGNSSTGFRVKRRTGGPPPVYQSGTQVWNQDSWASGPAPQTIHYTDNRDYILAFWSVTATDAMSGQATAQIQAGLVANDSHTGGVWSVTAKAYYIWNFGLGGGDNALLIDAFDIQAADFIGDDFVDVTPDASGALTTAANNGYIDTTTQITKGTPLTIKARDTLPGKQFQYWYAVFPLLFSADPNAPVTVGSPDVHDIVVHYNDVVVAFAIYGEGQGPKVVVPNEHIFNPWWWIETHGGLVPPGPPPLWMIDLVGALGLGASARSVAPELRVGVLQLTARQLAVATAALKKAIRSLR